MPTGPANVNERDSDREIEKFLKQWMPLPHDPGDCPPFSVLEAAATGPVGAPQLDVGSKTSGHRDWRKHIEGCDYCTKMVELLNETVRPAITLEHIFAKASRDAHDIRTSDRFLGGAYMPNVLGGLKKSAVFGTRPRSAFAFAAVILIVAAVWFAGDQLNYFKTSDNIATVVFEKDYSRDILQTLDGTVAKLEQSDIKKQDEDYYVQDYNNTSKAISSLREQKKITKDERTEIAHLMVRYRTALAKQINNNQNSTTAQVRSDSAIQNEPDTAAMLSLFSNVEHAILKKNETVATGPTEDIPNPAVVKTLTQQLRVEFDNVDPNNVVVQDKLPNRSQEEADALVRGLQTFSKQNYRTVDLTIGGGSMTITPATSFARFKP